MRLGNFSLNSGLSLEDLRLDTYETLGFFICFVLYFFGLVYAFLQARLRCWMAETSRAAYTSFFAQKHGLTVSPAARARLLYISQNVTLALLLRLIWVVIKLFKLVPKPKHGGQSCHNLHTFVSAANRLSQLLFFTAFASVLTFWVELLQNFRAVSRQREGMQSREDLAIILANSTLRRQRGARIAEIPDLAEPAVVFQERRMLSPSSVQILVNFWAYASILILLTVQWFECDRRVYDWIYDGETVCIAFFFGLLSVGFVVHGRRLILELSRFNTPLANKLRRLCLVLIVSCLSVFPIRTILFLLRPVFHVQLSGLLYKIAYPWFFYPMPELFPAVVLLHMMTPRSRDSLQVDETGMDRSVQGVDTPLIQEERIMETFGSIGTTEQGLEDCRGSESPTLWV